MAFLISFVQLSAVTIASFASLRFTKEHPITYGPRPFWLVEHMSAGPLKAKLKSCMMQPPLKSYFSIGHRGAPMQFPEHTRESYIAAAEMGAGIIECDVTFTKDHELVCRHSQCDLHTTTNILLTDLAFKCSTPFSPASNTTKAAAKCCTSDLTLAEFKTLNGKMDASYDDALTPEEYVTLGTPSWRTDLYSTIGTLMTHAESIQLFKQLNVQMTPELKSPSVEMPSRGFTQQQFARKLIDEYVSAGVPPTHVRPQSSSLHDIYYWIDNTPKFGAQAVYLDERYKTAANTLSPSFRELYTKGVRMIAPPLWILLKSEKGEIVQTEYSTAAKNAGLHLIAWTIERSGAPPSGRYFQTFNDSLSKDGDVFKVIDVLAQNVSVFAIFSDWPSTVTYYANCFDFGTSKKSNNFFRFFFDIFYRFWTLHEKSHIATPYR